MLSLGEGYGSGLGVGTDSACVLGVSRRRFTLGSRLPNDLGDAVLALGTLRGLDALGIGWSTVGWGW